MGRTDAKTRLGLTDAGKMLLRGTGFILLAALVIPAFGVLTALVATLVTALLVGFALRPRIRITGTLPDHVVAGQSVRLHYRLTNIARLPAYDLRVEFAALPETIEQMSRTHGISRLGPGETAEATVLVRPHRRGHYRIQQPFCESSFPFNLLRFGASGSQDQTLTVLPEFYPLRMPLSHLNQCVTTGHIGLAGRTEVSPEYIGSRPFLTGDSPRRIDARAWARLSVPATKEYHNDVDSRTALLLDTRIPAGLPWSPGSEIKELEAAVSLCASVAFSINRDSLIDLLLAGPDLHEFARWPRMTRLDKIHEVLAGVEPSKRHSLETVVPTLTESFYRISEVVFIILAWDRTWSALLEQASQAGCHSTVLLIGTAEGTHPDEDQVSWNHHVRVLSPDEILTGRIRQI